MRSQVASKVDQPTVNGSPVSRLVVGIDAVLLGLIPVVCAIAMFIENFVLRGFIPGSLLVPLIWASPLVFYLQNGWLIESQFSLWVGHGLGSILPGLVFLAVAGWAMLGKRAANKTLVVLAVVICLLEIAATFTIRSFGSMRPLRWAFSAVLIGLNAWYFLRLNARQNTAAADQNVEAG